MEVLYATGARISELFAMENLTEQIGISLFWKKRKKFYLR